MIAIVDYGVGNLFSLKSSLKTIGADVIVTDSEAELRAADKIILPGVGAFADAVEKLMATGLDRVIIDEAKNNGKPLMGICLGMQMLFEKSYEYGEHSGLALLSGSVVSMDGVIPPDYKIPHIGWNSLEFKQQDCPIFSKINNGSFVYFVHSFYATECDESLAATTEYGAELTAAVAYKNIFGCQFHPEKSGEVGLNILRAFCSMEDII